MKTFSALIFLVLVGGVVFFAWGRLSAPGSLDNSFNKNFRAKFDHSTALRALFGLHDDGDARYDYLGTQYKKIVIEVDSQEGLLPDKEILQEFTDRVAKVTGKPAEFLLSDIDLPQDFGTGADDLTAAAARYQNHHSNGDTAYLYLLIVEQAGDEPLLIGKTLNEDGVVLYHSALKEFTFNHPNTLPNYELSTAVHEFGHQLGLQHNDQDGCIMGEHAESNHVAKADPSLVVTDFCEFELGLIKSMAAH